MKSEKRYKKPKPRIKVAPPGKRHKSKKDYDRKKMKGGLGVEEFFEWFEERHPGVMDDLRKHEELEKKLKKK